MSRHTDPQEMVRSYGERIARLIPIGRRISLSRRGLSFPQYRITRSTTWPDEINPWKQKDRLPLFKGGLLADWLYGEEPVVRSSLWRCIMRSAICLLLFASLAGLWSSYETTTATARQGGRQLTFANGMGTQVEGLVVALLGSSSVIHDENSAAKESWDQALNEDYDRVRFPKPRVYAVDGEPETIAVTEILVTISAATLPDRLLVRNEDRYRAVAKYDPHICVLMQDRILKGILTK